MYAGQELSAVHMTANVDEYVIKLSLALERPSDREEKQAGSQVTHLILDLKRPQVTETRTCPRIGYALITAKTQVKIHFVQYLNFN